MYGYSDADWTITPVVGHEHLVAEWTAGASDEVSSHRLQLSAILDALAAGAEPSVGAEEARRTLEFAAATYASAFRGVPVSAGDIVDPDPFRTSMDGGAVPWPRLKEAL